MLYRAIDRDKLELRANLDRRIVEGYASVFDVVDQHGTRFSSQSFNRTLATAHERARVKHLLHHNPSLGLGVPEVLEADSRGLRFRTVAMNTRTATEALEEIDSGFLSGMSVGFDVNAVNPDDSTLFTDVTLWEISSVTWGSNEEAFATVRSGVESDALLQQLEALAWDLRASANVRRSARLLRMHLRGQTLARILESAVGVLIDMDRTEAVAHVAQMVGLGTTALDSILQGDLNCPTIAQLEQMADALQLPLADLIAAAEADGCTFEAGERSGCACNSVRINTPDPSIVDADVVQRINDAVCETTTDAEQPDKTRTETDTPSDTTALLNTFHNKVSALNLWIVDPLATSGEQNNE